MKRSNRLEVLLAGAAPTPLGRVSHAALIHHKTGTFPWRVLGSYALVYILGGGGRYQDVSGPVQDIETGDLIAVFPEVPHWYGPRRDGEWTEMHLVFDGPAFDLWRQAGLLDAARPVCRLTPTALWQDRLRSVVEDSAGDPPASGLAAVSRLLSLLADVAAQQRPASQTSPAEPIWVGQARHLLGGHLDQDMPVAGVAARLGLSYETFRKSFERQTGVAPARYRAAKRLEAARALLLHTDLTGRQIADRLGFPDEFYFSRRFKQAVGVSPRAFRRRSGP